jgi:hypothetical protein
MSHPKICDKASRTIEKKVTIIDEIVERLAGVIDFTGVILMFSK